MDSSSEPLGYSYLVLLGSYTSKTYPDSSLKHTHRNIRVPKQLQLWHLPIRSLSLESNSYMASSLDPLESSYMGSKVSNMYPNYSQWVQRHPRVPKQLHSWHRPIRSSSLESTSPVDSSLDPLESLSDPDESEVLEA